MRRPRIALLLGCIAAMCFGQQKAPAAKSKGAPVLVEWEELESHHIVGSFPPFLRIKLQDSEQADLYDGVLVHVTTDSSGNVAMAVCPAKPDFVRHELGPEFCSAAEAAAREVKYHPFIRNGQPVPAEFDERVLVFPPERTPVQHIPFPEVRDRSTVKISLWRGRCYGLCPIYRVEIKGDGTVHCLEDPARPSGCGKRLTSISQEAVQQLVNLFREADYFSLDDSYSAEVDDVPAFETSIEVDGHLKKVRDYDGLHVGMPMSVVKLEAAIDQVAGSGGAAASSQTSSSLPTP
jgi:hypothetical protein